MTHLQCESEIENLKNLKKKTKLLLQYKLNVERQNETWYEAPFGVWSGHFGGSSGNSQKGIGISRVKGVGKRGGCEVQSDGVSEDTLA